MTRAGAVPPRLMRALTEASSDSTANTSWVMAGSMACISARLNLSSATPLVSAAFTMLPAMLMFFVQSSLLGWNWMLNNFYLANGTFFSCAILIAVLGTPATPDAALDAFRHGWEVIALSSLLAAVAGAVLLRPRRTRAAGPEREGSALVGSEA